MDLKLSFHIVRKRSECDSKLPEMCARLKNNNSPTAQLRSTREKSALGSVGYLQAGKVADPFTMRCGSEEKIMNRENAQGWISFYSSRSWK